jgi:hypothetical protein
MSFERIVPRWESDPAHALIWSEAVYKSAGAPYTTPARLGTEGWNRTNVEGFKDLRPATERPRRGTDACFEPMRFEPAWIALAHRMHLAVVRLQKKKSDA